MSFATFTDEELRDLAEAMDSAAGEGGFGNVALAQKLVDEAKQRSSGTLPLAYGHGEVPVDEWINRSRVSEYLPV